MVGITGSEQGGQKAERGCRNINSGGRKVDGRGLHVLGGTWEELEKEIKGGNDGRGCRKTLPDFARLKGGFGVPCGGGRLAREVRWGEVTSCR